MKISLTIKRLGPVLEPLGPEEEEGVLNPASTVTRSGKRRLFPRCVRKGNISYIGEADWDPNTNTYNRTGRFALEPTGIHETEREGGWGTEDAHVTYIEPLDKWVMTYVATGDHSGNPGCRIAFAISDDGEDYTRLGLVKMNPRWSLPENNKDAMLFPGVVNSPTGVPSLAFFERNMPEYPPQPGEHWVEPIMRQPHHKRQSIGILYVHLDRALQDIRSLLTPDEYAPRVMIPDESWGGIKLGAGTPPIKIQLSANKFGWMTIYHGIDALQREDGSWYSRYSAGLAILDYERPDIVLFRSPVPILSPTTPYELEGTVNNVVFPTAIEQVGERQFLVWYGMADSRIGAFHMHLLKRPRRNGQHVRHI